MRTALTLSLLVFVVGTAAAPVDPVLVKVIAGARAVPPSSAPFERLSRTTTKDDKGASETVVRVDRWDGRNLVLMSENGKPATPEAAAERAKVSKGRPVPGYHRLEVFLGGGARRISEKPGQIVYRIDRLPKGSVDLNGDKSDKFAGEAVVDTSGAAPVVTRFHIILPKPFSIMFVAQVDKFDVVNDYGVGKDGRPVLLRSIQQLAGAQFGKAGETRTDSSYTPLR